jgi:hypothetical protein
MAEIGIYWIARHSEVSPLFPLMVCIHPVFETWFTAGASIRAAPSGEPDGIPFTFADLSPFDALGE